MHQIDQTMCPERVERKKLLGHHSKVALPFKKIQKQPPEMFYKKAVLKNLAIFARRKGKHLCWSPFLIKNIAKFLRAPILMNYCEQLLLKMCP